MDAGSVIRFPANLFSTPVVAMGSVQCLIFTCRQCDVPRSGRA